MKHRILLAPLSGVTDLSFRLIARGFGARFCFFEMLDAGTFVNNFRRSARVIKTVAEDRPIAAQLLGADPDIMLEAALMVSDLVDVKFLDVNSACPAKKIVARGAGAALLTDTKLLGRIVHTLSSRLKKPVTVKLRTSFHKIPDAEETIRIARVCEENGASMVFVHGRTVPQGYAGDVDYGSIRAVKKALRIPVYGSGNIVNPVMAKKMLDETGCDGIMVARGALGNPWIFKAIERYLKNGGIVRPPAVAAKKKVLKKHLSYLQKYSDARPASTIGIMGKVAMWYLKGLPGAPRLRERICKVRSFRELTDLIDGVED